MFSCEFWEISKNTFFYRTPPVAASVTYSNTTLTWHRGRQKHEFKVFIFLLDEIGMAQNNSLFIWKTSNYSRGRSNLRNDMNQVTNPQSLAFTQERIGNLMGVFPGVVLCDTDFCIFVDVAFDLHIFSIVRFVVELVLQN